MESARGVFERGISADLWRHTLTQIPSVFGRLVYLASLRNSNTGCYEHHGLIMMFGEEPADKALRDSHAQAFAEWLNYGLEHQKADLDLYLSSLSADKKTLIDTWLRLSPYRNVAPSDVLRHEMELYMADMEALLGLLKNEHGVVSPDQDA